MYVGTKYEEERRIREKRKKEGSRLCGRCYCSPPNFNSVFWKCESSKHQNPACGRARCSPQEYVAHNYILHKVLKYESRKKAPPGDNALGPEFLFLSI